MHYSAEQKKTLIIFVLLVTLMSSHGALVGPLVPSSSSDCAVNASQSGNTVTCTINGNCCTPPLNPSWTKSKPSECTVTGTNQCCNTSPALTSCYSGSSNEFCTPLKCTIKTPTTPGTTTTTTTTMTSSSLHSTSMSSSTSNVTISKTSTNSTTTGSTVSATSNTSTSTNASNTSTAMNPTTARPKHIQRITYGDQCGLELGLGLGLGLGIQCVITCIIIVIFVYKGYTYANVLGIRHGLGLGLGLGVGITFHIGWIIITSLISTGNHCKFELGLGLGLGSCIPCVIACIISMVFVYKDIEVGKGIITGLLIASVIGIVVFIIYEKLKPQPTVGKHEGKPPEPPDKKNKT